MEVKRKVLAKVYSSKVSEGIQNVIFNPTNTSVVWVLKHTELTELSLPKVIKSRFVLVKKKKLSLPAFPHNKHTVFFCTTGFSFSLTDTLHNAKIPTMLIIY